MLNRSYVNPGVKTLCFILACILGTLRGQDRIYVFFPTLVEPLHIQEALSSKIPAAQIIVFSRLIDFNSFTVADSPSVIIARPRCIDEYARYSIQMNGLVEGKTTERYVLLTQKKSLQPITAQLTIGMVDFLGKKGMRNLIETIFSPAPQLSRVTQLQDILPLLTYDMANAALVPEKDARYFIEISKIDFVMTPIEFPIGYLAVAGRTDRDCRKLIEAIRNLSSAELTVLGVEKWK
jgi:hypothetical protein